MKKKMLFYQQINVSVTHQAKQDQRSHYVATRQTHSFIQSIDIYDNNDG